MIQDIFSFIANIIISIISSTGYVGVGTLMAIDSCNIPIPSEVTMPFAGFLAQQGTISLWGVIIAGTVGSVLGSLISYELAIWIVRQRSRISWLRVLFSDHALARAEQWFVRYGSFAVCIGRVVPVVRTFISLPAGIAHMHRGKFFWYTVFGSFVWSVVLTYAGYFLGTQWHVLELYIREIQYVLVCIGVCGVVWYGVRRYRSRT